MNKDKNDFSQGSVVKNIMSLAVPMTLAQLINVLYNIVDRIYIGRIPQDSTLSLTGIGLSLPIITMVIAFANLFGMGGAPLCSIERGRGRIEEAEKIMGNSFTMMVISGVLLTAFGLIFKRPMLYLFGASDSTWPFADAYITIYLFGHEQLYQFPGIWQNRNDDRSVGSGFQYHSGSDFYFCPGYGREGSRLRHDHIPVFIGALDCQVPDGGEDDTQIKALLPETGAEED